MTIRTPSIVLILGLALLAGCTTYPAPGRTDTEGTVCTMDAKLCPDGSYVGRSGPQCEFAPCPGM